MQGRSLPAGVGVRTHASEARDGGQDHLDEGGDPRRTATCRDGGVWTPCPTIRHRQRGPRDAGPIRCVPSGASVDASGLGARRRPLNPSSPCPTSPRSISRGANFGAPIATAIPSTARPSTTPSWARCPTRRGTSFEVKDPCAPDVPCKLRSPSTHASLGHPPGRCAPQRATPLLGSTARWALPSAVPPSSHSEMTR